MTIPEQRILASLKWSQDRFLHTVNGLQTVRTAAIPARHRFWKLWRTKRAELKALGYTVSKPDLSWRIFHWDNLK